MANNNGLSSKDEVKDACFSASYLVLGLGDVYLGAPCAVPLDPRHRLVTTKYNPARTFTAEGTVGGRGRGGCECVRACLERVRSGALVAAARAAAGGRSPGGLACSPAAVPTSPLPGAPPPPPPPPPLLQVGIGGSYMCIYPMNSPGGYQLVGRTLPIWNTFGRAGPFSPDKPWLLQFFDQVRARPRGRRQAAAAACVQPPSGHVLPHAVCAPPAKGWGPELGHSRTNAGAAAAASSTPPLHPQVRFYLVSEEELEAAREGFQSGQYQIKIEQSTFDMAAYTAMLETINDEVAAMKERQKAAMEVQVGRPGAGAAPPAGMGVAGGVAATQRRRPVSRAGAAPAAGPCRRRPPPADLPSTPCHPTAPRKAAAGG
jgi:hypothetical protein